MEKKLTKESFKSDEFIKQDSRGYDVSELIYRHPYLPTPPLGQDMTQSQVLSGV